jgi:hypothetical protein
MLLREGATAVPGLTLLDVWHHTQGPNAINDITFAGNGTVTAWGDRQAHEASRSAQTSFSIGLRGACVRVMCTPTPNKSSPIWPSISTRARAGAARARSSGEAGGQESVRH